VPHAMQREARSTMPHGSPEWGRLGPFATRQEALQALEDWWLRRLGVDQ
jgi:hypothetical protein